MNIFGIEFHPYAVSLAFLVLIFLVSIFILLRKKGDQKYDEVFYFTTGFSVIAIVVNLITMPFSNYVGKGEFAVYQDGNGKFVLQAENSGLHFGLYQAYYFDTDQRTFCEKDAVVNSLGKEITKAINCYGLSLDQYQLASNIITFKGFGQSNTQNKKYNTSKVFLDLNGNYSKPPDYFRLRKID